MARIKKLSSGRQPDINRKGEAKVNRTDYMWSWNAEGNIHTGRDHDNPQAMASKPRNHYMNGNPVKESRY